MEDDPAARDIREDRVFDLRFELVEPLIREREAQFVATGFREDRVEGGSLEILELISIEEERNALDRGAGIPSGMPPAGFSKRGAAR